MAGKPGYYFLNKNHNYALGFSQHVQITLLTTKYIVFFIWPMLRLTVKKHASFTIY